MGNPIISIIIPVYNSEKYLRTCLDSILAQTFTDWEAILVDDGSNDTSAQICDEYVEKSGKFKVIHKENGGVSSARQAGTDCAKGEYIIHVDSDDWVERNMLQDLYEKASEGFDMVITDILYEHDGQCSYWRQTDVSNSDELLKALLDFGCYGALWNKLVKSHLYKSFSFPHDLFFSEDVYVLIQILLNNSLKIANLHQAHYHYIYRSGTITNTHSKRTFDNYMLFLNKTEVLLSQKKGEDRYLFSLISLRRQRFIIEYTEYDVFSSRQLLSMFNSIKKDTICNGLYLEKYRTNRRRFYKSLVENSCVVTKKLFSLFRKIKSLIRLS